MTDAPDLVNLSENGEVPTAEAVEEAPAND